ncbi:MAG: S8 family serine peptidase [candidate division Zixibacteria bacterium]|nr:S8 family serine peptidase [candidate division Zixibacteria bacterium]
MLLSSKKVLCFLLLASLFIPLSAQAEILYSEDGYRYLSDQMIIGISQDCPKLNMGDFSTAGFSTGIESLDLLCSQYGVVSIQPWYEGKIPDNKPHLKDVVERMYIAKTNELKDIKAVVSAFTRDNHLEYAELYDIPIPYYEPNDPSINSQWFLGTVSAFEAWDIIRGEETDTAIVGISDTGVYWEHPDLYPNLWLNDAEDINNNGQFDNYPVNEGGDLDYWDDDDNGYEDDVIGYDLMYHDADPSEPSPIHGTHVAGCASEATDNGIGGAGVGFSARIMSAKGGDSNGNLYAVYQAITYCAASGAHFCNCSWGSSYYNQGNQNVCTAAFNDGCLVIAAAGNESTSSPHYPSAYDNVFAVAATSQNNAKASFSNWGDWVDISAPGVSIYSTWGPTGYASLGGTSMASPITSGAAALVQAQQPSRQPQDIIDILMATADSATLYAANPNYEGELGAGLVDAYAALAASSEPNIQLVLTDIYIVDDDGDGIANPGESIELTVMLTNLWADALNVEATLNDHDAITIEDGFSQYGDISSGEEVDNSEDPFKFTINDNAPLQLAELILDITADGNYSTEVFVPFNISLNMPEFPLTADGNIEGHMAFANFDADPGKELIFGSHGGYVYVVHSDGTIADNFPVAVDGDIVSGIAIGNVAGDWRLDLVATTKTGHVYAIDHEGQVFEGFPIAPQGGSYYATPSVADIDHDGLLEMFCPNFGTSLLYAYDNDGSELPGFPVSANDARFYGSCAIGDIDNDNELEIIAGNLEGDLFAWNHDGTVCSGFPIEYGEQIWVSPALGDIDGNGTVDVVLGTQAGNFYALNSDGSEIFQLDFEDAIRSDAALADVDQTEGLEIFVGTNGNKIFGITGGGNAVDGWPVELGGQPAGSPVVADIDGDGEKEILVSASNGIIYGFNADGSVLDNFPIPAFGTITTSAIALGDIDGDNDVEIAAGLRQVMDNVLVVDYKESTDLAGFDWVMYGHNENRTHYWNDFTVGIDDDDPDMVPTQFKLTQNYPNPFNPVTKIGYSLPTGADVRLVVYNLTGQRVAELVNEYQQAGNYEVKWDSRNDGGGKISSGIYFYRLEAGENVAVKKMVLVK